MFSKNSNQIHKDSPTHKMNCHLLPCSCESMNRSLSKIFGVYSQLRMVKGFFLGVEAGTGEAVEG